MAQLILRRATPDAASVLGLEFDPGQDEIRFRDPHLPSFLDSVRFSNLRLGESSVDLVAHRQSGNVSIEIVRAPSLRCSSPFQGRAEIAAGS